MHCFKISLKTHNECMHCFKISLKTHNECMHCFKIFLKKHNECMHCFKISYVNGGPNGDHLSPVCSSIRRVFSIEKEIKSCPGEQMSCRKWKNRPRCSPANFCRNGYTTFAVERSCPKIWATSSIFKRFN
jgi:hypothetical protein